MHVHIDEFKNDYVHINTHGISELTSKVVIEFREIEIIEIKKNSPYKNPVIPTLLGLLLCSIGAYLLINNIPSIDLSGNTRIQSVALFVYTSFGFIFFAGLVIILHANWKIPVIQINTHNREKYIFPIQKANLKKIPALYLFLKKKATVEHTLKIDKSN